MSGTPGLADAATRRAAATVWPCFAWSGRYEPTTPASWSASSMTTQETHPARMALSIQPETAAYISGVMTRTAGDFSRASMDASTACRASAGAASAISASPSSWKTTSAAGTRDRATSSAKRPPRPVHEAANRSSRSAAFSAARAVVGTSHTQMRCSSVPTAAADSAA